MSGGAKSMREGDGDTGEALRLDALWLRCL